MKAVPTGMFILEMLILKNQRCQTNSLMVCLKALRRHEQVKLQICSWKETVQMRAWGDSLVEMTIARTLSPQYLSKKSGMFPPHMPVTPTQGGGRSRQILKSTAGRQRRVGMAILRCTLKQLWLLAL